MPKEKRIVRPESPADSPETSRPFSRIELDPALISQLRLLSREARREIGVAINQIGSTMGRPHRHSGIGLRKLRGRFFEGRCGLSLRLIFELLDNGTLYFHLIGTHDEVRHFLKRH